MTNAELSSALIIYLRQLCDGECRLKNGLY